MFATILLGCVALVPLLPQEAAKPATPPAAVPPPIERPAPIERKGTLLPADAIEIALWLDAYRDELLVLDAVPHGSPVNEGDVLVRLDLSKIDDQIKQAEFALAQQVERARLSDEDMRVQDETSAAELSRLRKDAEWATRRLKGFLEQEKAHKKEGERLHEQGEQNRLEDQVDELTQLEKMYKEDELVDATEEIVLKRSRRGLASLRAGIALQQLVRRYTRELAEVIQQEGMELDVAQKQAVVARQTRSAEQRAAGRKLDAEKTRTELDRQQLALARLRKDRDQMIVRAPRRGVALYGEPRAVPGSLRIERGSVLALRKTFMTVAEPGRFEVLTDLDEGDVAKVKLGAAVEVVPSGISDLELLGSVRVADLPTARDGNGNNLYEARVALEKTDSRLRFHMRCKVLIRQSVGSR